MAELNFHARVPISGDGFAEIEIKIPSVAGTRQCDLEFIQEIVADFCTMAAVAAKPPPELPAVLRGIGGRP
jgi:hypothetical protein